MSHSNYVSAAELTDGDDVLDFSLDSVGELEPYSTAVQNIFSRHCEEIRTSVTASTSMNIISRRRLREIASQHNNEIFSFLQRPDRTPHQNGIAELIVRRYGHDIPSLHRHQTPISRDLNLDASMSPVFTYLDEQLSSVVAGGTFANLTAGLRWAFTHYKQLGEQIIELDARLKQKLEMIDKLHARMPFVTGLASNEAYQQLLDAFEQYIHQTYRDANIESIYKELIDTYKRWTVLREVITSQMTISNSTEPLCSICLNDNVSSAVIPCGHTFCTGCTRKMTNLCYICRGTIRDKMKLYFN
jgi:hypothetical protein